MTVADFIKVLQAQDQGATVRVLEVRTARGYYDYDTVKTVVLDPIKHLDYTDFRNNPFAKDKDFENHRYLDLGG